MVETVFKTIKSKLIWRTAYKTRQQAEAEISQYIDGFYNPRRRHSALGYMSPIQFESFALWLHKNPFALHFFPASPIIPWEDEELFREASWLAVYKGQGMRPRTILRPRMQWTETFCIGVSTN